MEIASNRPRAHVPVLPGGNPVSSAVGRPWQLANLRMTMLTESLRYRLTAHDITVGQVRYRYRGWNGDRMSPVQDALRVLDDLRRRRKDVRIGLVGHPHQALRLLTEPTALAGNSADGVVVTYDMTRLMRITTVTDRRFLVTLGGTHLVDPSSVLAEMSYEHPLYTPHSVAAQARLPELGSDTVAFAGAYHGWGFHEDGARSGVQAARRLGADWDAHAVPAAAAEERHR